MPTVIFISCHSVIRNPFVIKNHFTSKYILGLVYLHTNVPSELVLMALNKMVKLCSCT